MSRPLIQLGGTPSTHSTPSEPLQPRHHEEVLGASPLFRWVPPSPDENYAGLELFTATVLQRDEDDKSNYLDTVWHTQTTHTDNRHDNRHVQS